MRALLLDVNNKTLTEVNPNGLDDYYNMINCKWINIVNREINGKRYDIICDDEGLFVENPKISAFDIMLEPMLVGNLIICGTADCDGYETDLTNEDIKHIKENTMLVTTRKYPEGVLALCKCDY